MDSKQFKIKESSRSVASSVSIENSKGQSITSSNTVSQIINTESIMKTFVIDKENLNAKNEFDWTPLYRTVIGGNNTATEQLLKMGADPNIQCNMGETALFQAVEMEKLSQIETLLKHKADVNLTRNDGLSPLHAAILKDNLGLVDLLLKYGSNTNLKNKLYWQTPVHIAIKNSVKPAILLLLVQYGGSLTIKDKYNMRPIDYASTQEMKETIAILKTQKEEAFVTPQKERGMSFNGNTNQKKTHISSYSNSYFNNTPSKIPTTNYNFNHLTIKTSSEKSEISEDNNRQIIQTRIETVENVQIGINNINNNENFKNGKNHPFSPSEYAGTNTLNDLKFDSFITKNDGYNLVSKTGSPKENDGISELNPLDTIYSAYNTTYPNFVTSNNISPTPPGNENSTGNRNQDYTQNMDYLQTNNENSIITEYENEDSISLKKSKRSTREVSIKRLENININSLISNQINSISETDDLQYTPSKTSYVVSDIPGTSGIMDGSDSKLRDVSQKLDFGYRSHSKNSSANIFYLNKIKYHNKENSNPNFNSNPINNSSNKSSFRNKDNLSFQNCISNTHITDKNIKASPNYKRKLNFSNMNSNINKEINNLLIEDELSSIHFKNNPHCKMISGTNSTRNNSTNLMTEDNMINKKIRKKLLMSEYENSHSNKTIIHYGPGESVVTSSKGCETLHTCGKKIKKISLINDCSIKNSPNSAVRKINRSGCNLTETLHCISDNANGNISTRDAKILHEWLIKIGMQNYYNNFLENGLFSIEKLVNLMNNPQTRITFKDLEEIGIRKPGHIFRILIQLEVDAKIIDENLINIIFSKRNSMKFSIESKMANSSINLKISNEKEPCCTVFGNNKIDKVFDSRNNGFKSLFNYDLISWLKKINLSYLRKHFVHNGFDSMEFVILQMFSSHCLDDSSIEDHLHIYNRNERRIILNQLVKEVKIINSRLYNNYTGYLYTEEDSKTYLDNEKMEEGCKLCLIF